MSFVRKTVDSFSIYFEKRLIVILLLGFSSGLPLLLTLSTLSFWFAKVGIDKKTIGLFALVGLPYVWKFVWAPLLDRFHVPFLSKKLGRRRGWLLFIQICLAASIIMMGHSQPEENLFLTAVFALCVSFFSATQDILIDAYRIESLAPSEYAAGGGVEVFGYRLGMIVAGGFALSLSDSYSWSTVYLIMGLFMGVGMLTTLFCKEPPASKKVDLEKKSLKTVIIDPFLEFIKRPGWFWVLLFIILYRFGDNIIGQMATVFYQKLGFTGTEIGMVTKTFGIWMVVVGGLLGGAIAKRIGIMKTLLWGGILHILSNGFFIALALHGHSMPYLYGTIISENLSGGIMTSAFVAYLSRLCNINFTATQYALLSALMAVGRVFVQSSSGFLAERFDWVTFFVIASAAALPGLFLLTYLMKRFPINEKA
ncbi:MAG: AmpG family muropeptide MFS transporter [Alphaproteobacteria bacterium]